MISFGVWTDSDGGFCDGPFDHRKEAEDFLAEQLDEIRRTQGEEDYEDAKADLSVKGICPDHEGQPRIGCEECDAEYDETPEDEDDE